MGYDVRQICQYHKTQILTAFDAATTSDQRTAMTITLRPIGGEASPMQSMSHIEPKETLPAAKWGA